MKFAEGIAFPDDDDFMMKEIARSRGRYQLDHLDVALRHVRNFDAALDGGAHVGVWTRALAQLFRLVIAVEPSTDTYEALRENVRHWGLTNVETHHVALGASEGLVTMALDPVQKARHNVGGRYVSEDVVGQRTTVSRVTIDGHNLKSLGLLKLDVEGSEYPALLGAIETLRRCRPIVIIEDKHLGEKFFGYPVRAAQAFLSDHGYRLLDRAGCDEIWGPA